MNWIRVLAFLLLSACLDRDASPLPTTTGCTEAELLVASENPGERGPWPVGARTVSIDGLTAEVWYPGRPGSEAGRTQLAYDLRLQLPPAEQGKIPDANNPAQVCPCFENLPADRARGPYPLVLFLHGLGGFRTQSAQLTTHWASRGFVVIAADHPGAKLGDVLVGRFGSEMPSDARRMLDAVGRGEGLAGDLQGLVDVDRMGVVGHSLGGSGLTELGDRAGVQVLIPMAAGGTAAGGALVSTLIMGAVDDQIVPYPRQQDGYVSSPTKKRFVGLANAGHLAFSDLCAIGREQGGILQIGMDFGVSIPSIFADLATDGCRPEQLPAEEGWKVIRYATAGVLEETLHCKAGRAARLSSIQNQFSTVSEYREAL